MTVPRITYDIAASAAPTRVVDANQQQYSRIVYERLVADAWMDNVLMLTRHGLAAIALPAQ